MTDRNDHATRRGTRTSSRARRLLTLLLSTVAISSLAAAGAVAASSLFVDVDPGATHEEGISWLTQTGVTGGCAADAYCPDDPVTRAQMATFLWRLSGNADGVDPMVDAERLGGLTLAEVLAASGDPSGDGEIDADLLGGLTLAEVLDAAEEAAQDAVEDSLEPPLWAVVEADGTSTDLARGSGATDASGGVGTEGRFTVTFDRDVSECSYQATADVAPTKDNANVAEVRPGPTDEAVDVWVTNTEFGWVNTGFHLHVMC